MRFSPGLDDVGGMVQQRRDPRRFPAADSRGVVGKTITVLVLVFNWAVGNIEWPLLLFAAVDGIYAALFWRFLKRYPA